MTRVIFMFALVIVFFLFGTARLLDIQVLRGSYFQGLAEGNRIRRIPIKAARGEILDRDGRALARNVPVYKLGTFSSGGVVVSSEVILREKALAIQGEAGWESGRLLIEVSREYPLGAAGSHVVGYVNEVSPEELGDSEPECSDKTYQLGDLKGRGGVEAYYDCVLRGINGEELVEVDTQGKIVRRLGRKDPVAGTSINLELDADLQTASYNSLLDAVTPDGVKKVRDVHGVVRGAVVAQDPDTGEVLSLVSVPSFDPSSISALYSQLSSDVTLPLFNRAIGGAYPPGSTFKIAVALAGLEDGKINREYEYQDIGFIEINNFLYRNWYFTQYGRSEGAINIVRAITRSTDTFFYKVGGLVGPSRLAFWASGLGLGANTGIDLYGEVGGLVPTPDWKLGQKGERWFLGNTYHMAIGQGDVLATPLQVNQLSSVIAANGLLCTPHLLKNGESQSEKFKVKSSKCEDVKLEEETIQLIREGMVGACSAGGTAFPFFQMNERLSEEEKVGCKTGTAQFAGSDNTHAWLTAFAAKDDRKIAVTVLVEEGGEGSRVAAPVAKEFIESWRGM